MEQPVQSSRPIERPKIIVVHHASVPVGSKLMKNGAGVRYSFFVFFLVTVAKCIAFICVVLYVDTNISKNLRINLRKQELIF